MPYSTKKWTANQIKKKRYKVWHAYWWRNRKKLKESNKVWARAHYADRVAYKFKTQYGITVEFYETTCKRMNSTCPICMKKKKLVVDHNHIEKRYRGLLCQNCNAAIGLLGDTADVVARALSYLKGETCVKTSQLVH